MGDKKLDPESMAKLALQSDKAFDILIEYITGDSRLKRQRSAAALAIIAEKDPKRVAPYTTELTDALDVTEAQTRWECLNALTFIVPSDSRMCDKAIPSAESALLDEDNGVVRLAAMQFLCKIGSTTDLRSTKVWPFIDQGIQCCHGDLEFNEMLDAVIEFSEGKINPEVKEELADRMKFDAENAKGALKNKAAQIVENAIK